MKVHVQSKRFQLDIRFGAAEPAKETVRNTTLTSSVAPRIPRVGRGRQAFGFTSSKDTE